jgi:hypothetical protein
MSTFMVQSRDGMSVLPGGRIFPRDEPERE